MYRNHYPKQEHLSKSLTKSIGPKSISLYSASELAHAPSGAYPKRNSLESISICTHLRSATRFAIVLKAMKLRLGVSY